LAKKSAVRAILYAISGILTLNKPENLLIYALEYDFARDFAAIFTPERTVCLSFGPKNERRASLV